MKPFFRVPGLKVYDANVDKTTTTTTTKKRAELSFRPPHSPHFNTRQPETLVLAYEHGGYFMSRNGKLSQEEDDVNRKRAKSLIKKIF